ncbi:hypothetical protein M514_27866 [Trichuris suis]|uniref:HTH psq-type domain-containing protein n=1 Tax=Trichuris suis TaxID=68888 RepID=A0A085MRW2_9BILA|nr:hypothetical protein M514_27866 [Trichuris suis]
MEFHDTCDGPVMSSVSLELNERKRKLITLERKVKVIALHESGKPVTDIAPSGIDDLNNFKDKKGITDAVKSLTSIRSAIITKNRAALHDDMERLLVIWMECQIQKNDPLNLLAIQAKARSLFETLKREGRDPMRTLTESCGCFCASKGVVISIT